MAERQRRREAGLLPLSTGFTPEKPAYAGNGLEQEFRQGTLRDRPPKPKTYDPTR